MLTVKINLIKLKNYNNQKTLLKNINFEIENNKVYTILGKNGAGKSSLILAISKLLNPKEFEIDAEIIFDNKNIYKISEDELLQLRKNKIKYVFQDAQKSFDQLKTIEYYFNNIECTNEEIDTLLDHFQLPPADAILKLHPYELSVGMAQRLNLILAFLAKPQILILDEPTSAVDPEIANLLLQKLHEFVQINNNSVLMITQDLTYAEKCSDSIAYIDNGCLTNFYETSKFFSESDNDAIKKIVEFNKLLH